MVRDNFRRFISPNELQKESLCYSDGMGFEEKETFYIDRVSFNNYLIMYTISGQLWCCQEGEKIAVNPGEAILLDLHNPHQYYFAEGVPSRIAWVHINGAPAAAIMEDIKKIQSLPIKMIEPEIYDLSLSLFEISDQLNQDIFRQSELCYSLLITFFKEVWSRNQDTVEGLKSIQKLRNHNSSHNSGSLQQEEFDRIIWHYISHNLHRDVPLDELAQVVSLSKYHFVRKFQSAFGTSPKQFITEEKIRQAKYQLMNTTEPVFQIAEALGFSTPGYFSKVFKQATGVSPSTFRGGTIV